MVGVTPPQPPPLPTAEEEALKRNTDCVYFLASPLTCKKGSECEYRHSDIARVNPRDCWYWLNGNCLNPKCGFRHPPLDGLLGTQVPTPVGPSLPPPHNLDTPAINAPYISGKQGVPCIFFQKGFCLKGDRCPFLHAPNSANNKVSQLAAATSATDPSTLHKTFGGLEKCTQEPKVPQMKVTKSVELPPQGKPAVRVDTALSRNGVAIDKYVPPPSGLDDELPRHRPTNAAIATSSRNGVAIDKYVPPPSGLDDELPRHRPTNVPLATDGNSINRSNCFHDAYVPDDHSILNGKDIDEFSREPSPGFDVLVDDELGDSDYYQNEDQFGRTRSHEGKNLNPMNDYDIVRSSDYKSMADVDRGMYHDPRDYDSYEYLQGQYVREERIASSERMMGGSALERRRYPRADSPDRIEESDLRHLLAKQRRGNGLRSVISRDHAHENYTEDRSYWAPRRDPHHLPPHEGSLSSRLRGRIKIPGRSSSPVNETGLLSEREMDRGRNRVRLSPPGRPQTFSHPGRFRDRIKGRVQEDFDNEGRNFRGSRIRRDIINDNNIEFNGPKSLAELKVGKNAESYEHMNDRQPVGKRKYPKLEGHQQSEGALTFEGPKPLSEILKRKRGSEAADFDSGMASGINEDKIQKGRKENLTSIIITAESQGILSSVSEDEANRVHSSKRTEGSKDASGDIGGAQEQVRLIHTEKGEPMEGHSSLHHNLGELENEKVKIGDEAMEDNEPENYDQTGESDYEQVDGEDYHLGEGENADPEEEYLDDDDFAKKMGLIYP